VNWLKVIPVLALAVTPAYAQTPTDRQALEQVKPLLDQAQSIINQAQAIVDAQLAPQEPPPPVFQVAAGGDLQAVFDAAPAGARIELEPGGVFGSVVLRPKAGATPDKRITITTRDCPAFGPGLAGAAQMREAQASLALIRPSDRWGFGISIPNADAGAGGMVNVECLVIDPVGPSGAGNHIRIGDGQEADPSRMAHHVGIRQVFMRGDVVYGTKNGISVNGADVEIDQVWIEEIFRTGAGIQDSQAIGGNVGKRVRVRNSYLSAASENILVGGDWIRGPEMVPEDWLFEDVILHKPLRWLREFLETGKRIQVKNLFELKHGRRMTARRVLAVNNWGPSGGGAQDGRGILLNYTTQSACSYCGGLEDVTLEDFVMLNSPGGINVQGHSWQSNSANAEKARRITLRHLYYHSNGGTGRPISIANVKGPHEIAIERSTFVHRATTFLLGGYGYAWETDPTTGLPVRVPGGPMQGLRLADSVFSRAGTYQVTTDPDGVHFANNLRIFVDGGLAVSGNVIGGASTLLLGKLNAAKADGADNVTADTAALEALFTMTAPAEFAAGKGADPARLAPVFAYLQFLPEQ
jgi:hypothetical protein